MFLSMKPVDFGPGVIGVVALPTPSVWPGTVNDIAGIMRIIIPIFKPVARNYVQVIRKCVKWALLTIH